ncbi:membrane alanyl aminopeptidase-like [Pectinophora gossypiella]|uniref:membrane alanyl aminopeptidase-like n=1 Tax=Pectinophora gossypiella TaxID=13191 RepID=UPI00214E1442|nr:membrane alanyl aminopeptidase-like [Pectinophora gossypiella]
MVPVHLLALSVALLSANALPNPPTRNTIFVDEQLPDGPFEQMNKLADVAVFNDAGNPYRLPTDTVPSHYNILWAVHITNFTYTGEVEIFLRATRPEVHEIVIHSSHTELRSISLTKEDEVIPITSFLDTEYEFLRIRPNTNLEYNSSLSLSDQTEYKLTINFEGAMRDDMYGIYRSWFKNPPDNTTHWMASTQFQGTSARYAFPCYDEPKFKATFNITIRHPTTHKSWSCTTLEQSVPYEQVGYDYVDDIYHKTPIMSTYLLALIVADYSTHPSNNELYEVIARSGAIDDGQGLYAYEVGQELLQTMSNIADIDFYSVNPNMKMTQAAIPDFSAGAMENWGLLTYREAYLMYHEEHTNKNLKQLIAYILSHEIAHMWFGNLVTNDWWDVLWLNEGFARYYQYFLTNEVETDMGFETRFIVEQVHTSLLSDSANNPQPLTNPGVGSRQSVSQMFSTISYNKGASVIRMTEHLLGSDVHKSGLQNYLKANAFGTVLPIDLFNALQEAGDENNAFALYGSDFSLAEYYRSWTEQPGHPVLNVQVDHSTGVMTITQRRFNINNGFSSTINSNYIVPITFASPTVNSDFDDTKPTHILRDTVTVINRGSIGDEWVIFNKQQTGFYRVNYDPYTWNLIAIALSGSDRTLIHEYNRAQIVNDVFQFARSGLMTYTRAFSILSFLKSETSYAPWVAAVTGFNWLRNRFVGTNLEAPLNTMIADWATEVMNTIGYTEDDDESFMTTYLRYQLAPLMCNVGVDACLQEAKNSLDNLLINEIEVAVDSRNWVYCNGLRQGSVEDYTRLWNRFESHNVYTEKIVLLQTLGCTPHVESINSFLDAIVQPNELIRRQDYNSAWNSVVSGNEGNTLIVFEYIRENLQAVIDAFGGANGPLSFVYSRLRTEADVNTFLSWAADNEATLGDDYNAVVNGARSVLTSFEWAATNADDLLNYIQGPEIVLETTSSTTTEAPAIDTSDRPTLVEPEAPELPDSASTTFLSTVLLSLALVVTLLQSF